MESPSVSAAIVLGMQIGALTRALHKAGILPIATVIEELQELAVAYSMKNPEEALVKDYLVGVLQAMTETQKNLPSFQGP